MYVNTYVHIYKNWNWKLVT